VVKNNHLGSISSTCLLKVFMREDPKVQKRLMAWLSFCTFEICAHKSCAWNVGEIDLYVNFINILWAAFVPVDLHWSYWHTEYKHIRGFIRSPLIESAAYCNQILLVPLYLNSAQNALVNWIIGLLLSLLCWP